VKLAAILLVSIGCTGIVVAFVLMRRKMEELRRYKDGEE
jgi:hypothetical protein